MQALVLSDGLRYCPDFPEPVLGRREVLIRLKLAGICATDLELIKGYSDFSGVIGHEFVGVVEEVDHQEDTHWLGKRVVGSINIGCKHCEVCRAEGPEHCLQRKVLGIRGKNGVFADYFTLPVTNLYAVPDQIPDDMAVFTEPLAAALRVLKQLAPLSNQRVAVLGPGRLGLLVAKVLSLASFDVIVLGRSESSLLLPKQWQLDTALVSTVPDCYYNCVVDATGRASGFLDALRLVKPQGTLILKSTFAPKEPIDLSKLVVGEINLIGSRCGPFAEALTLLLQKTVPVEKMIDGRFKLKDGQLALQQASQPGVRKILLQS